VGDGLPAVTNRGTERLIAESELRRGSETAFERPGTKRTDDAEVSCLIGDDFELPTSGSSIMGLRHTSHFVYRNLTREDGGRMVLAER